MSLESLANEMLLEIFEFFHTVDLLRAFHGLNSRFDTLLFVHFRHFHLNFRSISKNDFDLVCNQYLPLINDRIISLCLSDDYDTPQQSDLFLFRNLHFSPFIHLRSLSLYHIRSNLLWHTLVDQWHHLSCLTHFNMIECKVDWKATFHSSRLIDQIWKLSKLTHCRIRISNDHYKPLPVPTIISTSLKFFSINGFVVYLQDLASLIEHTPYLRRLHVHFSNIHDMQPLQSKFLSLTVLKVTNTGPVQRLIDFLQHTPNLSHLTVNTRARGQLDGHKWEQTITTYLPRLKVFQLNMEFKVRGNQEQELDKSINSFRSRFWLDERKWYIRCHWYPESISKRVHIYTLPSTCSEFVLMAGMLTRSTCPSDDDDCLYDHVQNLSYSPCQSSLRFCNIHHLDLKFPLDEKFWSIVPKLDRLVSLRLCVSNDAKAFLQTLLERAKNLSTLTYDSSSTITSNELVLLNSNLIIRQLDLQKYNHWFDEEECTQLSHSSLGIHCQVLHIKVIKRTSILDFIQTMTNLRALNVQCQDDDNVNEEHVQYDDDLGDIFLPRQEELVKWLKHHVSNEILISRDINELNHVRIWLR